MGAQGRDEKGQTPRDQIGGSERRRRIRHQLRLDAGEIGEHQRCQRGARAGTERARVQLSGMRPGIVDQVLDAAERRRRRHQQHVLRARHQHDGLEILDRIETLHRRQGHVHGQRLRAEMQRIAVRGGLRRRDGSDIAAAPAAVLHHDALAPGLGELLRDDAAERVDAAAGAEGDDDADGAIGIGLRRCAPVRSEDRS